MSELSEQMALFRFLRSWAHRYPELSWIHAVPNGLAISPAQAGKAKASGLTAGVWDIFCPFPRTVRESDGALYRYSASRGLYIELKVGANGLTQEQEAFRTALQPFGYSFAVCRSWWQAAGVLGRYLAIEDADWLAAVAEPPTQRPLFGPGSRGPRKARKAEEAGE